MKERFILDIIMAIVEQDLQVIPPFEPSDTEPPEPRAPSIEEPDFFDEQYDAEAPTKRHIIIPDIAKSVPCIEHDGMGRISRQEHWENFKRKTAKIARFTGKCVCVGLVALPVGAATGAAGARWVGTNINIGPEGGRAFLTFDGHATAV